MKDVFRLRATKLASVGIAALLAASAGGVAASGAAVPHMKFKGTVNYDAVLALTGAVGPYGSAGLAGIQEAAKLVNAAGGIDGKQVVVHYEDDSSTPGTALLAAETLQSQYPAPFMQAGSSTAETSAILPFTNPHSIVTFSLGTSTTVINPAINPDTFGLYASELQFDRAAAVALKDLKVQKVGLLAGNSSATQSELLYTNRFSAAGVTVAGQQTVSETGTDFTVALQTLKNEGATGVYANFATPTPFPIVARDMQQIGWNVPLLAGPAVDSPTAMSEFPSGMTIDALSPVLYLKSASALGALQSKFVKAVTAAGYSSQLAVAADYGSGLLLSAYAGNAAKSVSSINVLKKLNGLQGQSIADQLVGLPNPKYSPTVHTLDNGNFVNYWALALPGPGPRYAGKTISVPRIRLILM